MSRDKQIEEMVKILGGDCRCSCEGCNFSTLEYPKCFDFDRATDLYNAGYRKSADLAEEIFAEIEDALEPHIESFTKFHITQKIAELKKKYIGKDTNVTTKTEDN